MAEDRRRRTFGPVTLLGLAGGTLVAVGGTREWVSADGAGDTASAVAAYNAADTGQMPAATALALVALACWGVVLVTRGRVRRLVAALGALAAAGTAVTVVVGWSSTADALRDAYARSGADPTIGHTAWFWASAVGAVLALVAGVLAVRLVPGWPEMGARYDAPAAQAAPVSPEDASNLDLWRAMDEGHDPTA